MGGILSHFAAGDPDVLDVENNLYRNSYRKAYLIRLNITRFSKT